MRILLVCPFFPPENAIAALRIAKFAEHWADAGHEVQVVAREPVTVGSTFSPRPDVVVHRIADPLAAASRASLDASTRPSGTSGRWVRRTKSVVKRLVWPDVFFPWAVRAYRKHRALAEFDIVVASVGPFSALLLGAAIARARDAALVVDYRDLLATGPYYEHGPVRRFIDTWVEERLVTRAALLAGVSAPMVGDLESKFGVPSVTVMNGFEPREFETFSYEPSGTALRIVYCGAIYPGRRDPSALFEAIRILQEEDAGVHVRVDFYGRNLDEVSLAAARYGVEESVFVHGQVEHAESLRLQAEADLLLLLLWNDPREAGVLSGKLFEYIGARRPVLMLGLETGAAAHLVRAHQLGLVSNEARLIAAYLRERASEKATTGCVVAPPATASEQFTRLAQSDRFREALEAL
ncbi:glycosyltransferase [Agrococcus sp. TF02-05]|uniref:glycosyltransferase n=1 Tax=Agrococcus sp. TF02-05 TaxID=2815211 RepID=UPI001AA0E382|nr:glycosyltransferase [Agrococcus sp. TF02-05]MBO1769488.1 glycosyltransferase [Agrococcus sp. TF02-05]